MGAYVLGGALQGLGSGINSSVDIYNKQKQLGVENAIAKIKAEAEKRAADLDLYNKGGRLGTAPAGPGSVIQGQTLGIGGTSPASPAGGVFGNHPDLTQGTSFAAPSPPPPSLGDQAAAIPKNPYQQVTPEMYVDTTQTPFAQSMAIKDLLYGHQNYLQDVKGTQRLDQIGLQGDNALNTTDERGGFQVQTTGMRTAQSDKNSVRGNTTRRYIHDNPNPSYSPVQTMDANGNPTVSRFDKNTGATTPTGANGRPVRGSAGGAGGSPTQDIAGARALVADADSSMTAYEDKVLSGEATLSPEDMTLARRALYGDPKSTLTTIAEYALNQKNTELGDYIRKTKQFATGQRMTMAKGGSNAVGNAEALLSGAGAGSGAAGVQSARAYRHAAMSGKLHSGSPTTDTQPSGSSTQTPPTEQQAHYDAAASALTAKGIDPVSKLGPRP